MRILFLIGLAACFVGVGSARATPSNNGSGGLWSTAAFARSATLTPGLFSEVSSGITLIRTFSCSGTPLEEGSGFLVGTAVVMTARHVLNGACDVRVLDDGKWFVGKTWADWHTTGRANAPSVDVSTIRLSGPADGYVFRIRSWSAGIGNNVAALGHPLGQGISLTNGTVILKFERGGIPMLALRILGAQGGSGSPLVDSKGNVVGILQLGLNTGSDPLGQRTSGLILGIDLPSWWPTARQNLCRAYPNGGIPGCNSAGSAPRPKPTPTYHVQGCWVQYTGSSADAVSSSAATTTFQASDLLARGPQNFWGVVALDTFPTATIRGVKVSLIQPNSAVFGTSNLEDWTPTYDEWTVDFNWTFTDNSFFFQHPEITSQGTWAWLWHFPDGEECSSPFSIG